MQENNLFSNFIMPKAAKSQRALIRGWIKKFPEGTYTCEGKIIFCQRCNQQVSSAQYFQLKQHDGSAKHQANVALFQQKMTKKQQFLSEAFSNNKIVDPFAQDLCEALICANIPLEKLSNKTFKQFLERYCGRTIPDSSTLRKSQVKVCFEKTIEAAFYSENFTSIKMVVGQLEAQDAVCIQKSQDCFNDPVVVRQLAFLQSNYAIIPTAITKLETQGMTLAEVIDILSSVKSAISKTPGQIGEEVRQKFDNVFHKNPDLERLIDIAKVLDGEMTDIEMAPDMMAAMKFAPMTSCDVERSFSIYKTILTENRMRLKPENLEMLLICYCAQKI